MAIYGRDAEPLVRRPTAGTGKGSRGDLGRQAGPSTTEKNERRNSASPSILGFNIGYLFLAVLLGVSHHSLFGMLRSVNNVASRGVGMVCRLFVLSGVMMFGGFPVMAGSMRQVF
jgi:hypothetical protein